MLESSLVFLLIWAALIFLPCAAIGWLGFRFITRLGQYPSKTAVFQKNIMFIYFIIVFASFTGILVFFKILSSEQ